MLRTGNPGRQWRDPVWPAAPCRQQRRPVEHAQRPRASAARGCAVLSWPSLAWRPAWPRWPRWTGWGWWLRGRSGLAWYRGGRRPAPAPGLGELQAVLYSSTAAHHRSAPGPARAPRRWTRRRAPARRRRSRRAASRDHARAPSAGPLRPRWR